MPVLRGVASYKQAGISGSISISRSVTVIDCNSGSKADDQFNILALLLTAILVIYCAPHEKELLTFIASNAQSGNLRNASRISV